MPSLREARRQRTDAVEHTTSVLDAEERSSLVSWPTGYGLNDPAAIPPPGMYAMQRAGVPVTPHTSLQVDAVFTSLRIICGSITDLGNLRAYTTSLDADNIPYRVWEKTQPDILEETWGPDVMQYDGMEQTVMSMGLFGEAFWHTVDRDKLGYPSALEVLHPGFMKVEVDEGGRKIYEYGTPASRVTIPREDVTHIKKMSMPGSTRGLSTIEYGGVIFAIALAAMEYGQRWFAQGASPSYVLTTKGKLNQSEINRIAEKMLFEHGGLSNSHLPLILDGGMEINKIQSTPDEAQYLQTLEYARSAIFDWYGIPLFLRNNALERAAPEPPGVIQERSTAFIRFSLTNFLTPLTQAHSRLIPSSQNAAFDTSKFVEPDAKSLAAEILSLRNSQVMSSNEIRTRRMGLPPSAEQDADKIMMPLASNVAPSQTGDKDPTNEPTDEE